MTIQVAMLSYWHVHAEDYARQVQARPECRIAAVWDELPERGKAQAEKLGVPFYDNLETLLANPQIDAVVVDAPSSMHEEVITAAAKAGKHIFTEKVLAITTEAADRIIQAVRESGKSFMISLPRLTHAVNLQVKEIIDAGLLGQITYLRVRLAHDGGLPNKNSSEGWLPPHFYSKEQCGGGALIDLGCHPMYLTHFYLGMPEAVSAQFGYVTGRDVEDNAVVTLRYADGALAVVEAGFASRLSPFTLEVCGTEGCLMMDDFQFRFRSTKLELGAQEGWISPVKRPEALPRPMDQWIDHIIHGTPTTISIDQGRALTQLMEAANLSAASGKSVSIAE
ncbi:Gfo/Idh/MocA family protein [Paenibacillus sp. YN15]|uniref:Gfo/Idh/MocA family protein n=1 Tax=Paenibacillus sp. YN15 TaxID=1742774 RepID=UPI000DCB4FFF|nr:Gfo/Idh/MocA family oxidoreductase [Paenibacillus sp. YN15]RAU93672.1 gfo/Idh/MocA family oxidoreductase [Paenibacillus sp. YN15]